MIAPGLLLLLLSGTAPNLLEGASTTADARLTDGAVAREGDGWISPPAVELRAESWPQWDLGSSKSFAGAALQADHNDTYLLSVSEDGTTWTDAHHFGPHADPGLRTRSGTLSAQGRFVRLSARGGDGRFSAAELQLFADRKTLWTSPVAHPWLREPLRLGWVSLFLAAAFALFLVNARSSRRRLLVVAAALGAVVVAVLSVTLTAGPVGPALLNWIRAVVALSAFAAVTRMALFSKSAPAHAGFVTGVLGMTGMLAVLCFLNMGRPQFLDAGRNAPTFLHHYDMRAYFPIAKYFPELRFDGVYAASAAVVIEDSGLSDSLAALPMTNLQTNERPSIAQSQEYIRAVRARFTPERWSAFVADMNYFRRAMSDPGFLGSMTDHGGNATPVWFLGARLVFANASASDLSLWIGVLVDCLLVLLALVAIGWAYGPRTALVAMTVFGAMDLYMFGSNWFGAALRHDWMALWGIGLALLKKERFFLGGGLIAWAGLIRVFPIISFVSLTGPLLWALGHQLYTLRRGFSPRAFLISQKNFLHVAAGALAFGSALLLLSVLVFGVDAWPAWVHKILQMAGGRGINTIGLTSLLNDPILVKVTLIAFTLLTLFAIRSAPPDEAAAYGPALIAAVFSPMNYYLHCMFLLAVVGSDRRVFPWLVLLGMCVGCYFTTLTDNFDLHFHWESWVTVIAMAVLVGWRLVASRRPGTWPGRRPASIDGAL